MNMQISGHLTTHVCMHICVYTMECVCTCVCMCVKYVQVPQNPAVSNTLVFDLKADVSTR